MILKRLHKTSTMVCLFHLMLGSIYCFVSLMNQAPEISIAYAFHIKMAIIMMIMFRFNNVVGMQVFYIIHIILFVVTLISDLYLIVFGER